MRKPFQYELYLLKDTGDVVKFTEQGYEMPAWLAAEMRAYRRIYDLHQTMDSNRNGYTFGVNALIRIQSARHSLTKDCSRCSPQMARMLEDTICLIEELDRVILSHYDTKKTIQINDRCERRVWDGITDKIRDILNEVPDPKWRSMKERESSSPCVLVKQLWK